MYLHTKAVQYNCVLKVRLLGRNLVLRGGGGGCIMIIIYLYTLSSHYKFPIATVTIIKGVLNNLVQAHLYLVLWRPTATLSPCMQRYGSRRHHRLSGQVKTSLLSGSDEWVAGLNLQWSARHRYTLDGSFVGLNWGEETLKIFVLSLKKGSPDHLCLSRWAISTVMLKTRLDFITTLGSIDNHLRGPW
jgi:hypothetical protein